KNGKITAVKAMELLNLKSNTFYRRVKEYESIN
ncbi:MAG: recombinase family protein, partial [Bacilli bacterium]